MFTLILCICFMSAVFTEETNLSQHYVPPVNSRLVVPGYLQGYSNFPSADKTGTPQNTVHTNVSRTNLQDNNQESSKCKSLDVLLDILNNLLFTLTDNLKNNSLLTVEKVNAVLDYIKRYLEQTQSKIQDNEVYHRFKQLKDRLENEKEFAPYAIKKTIRSLYDYGPEKITEDVFRQYNLPSESQKKCKEAFSKLIQIAQNAYSQLAKHPMCGEYENTKKLYEFENTQLPIDLSSGLQYPNPLSNERTNKNAGQFRLLDSSKVANNEFAQYLVNNNINPNVSLPQINGLYQNSGRNTPKYTPVLINQQHTEILNPNSTQKAQDQLRNKENFIANLIKSGDNGLNPKELVESLKQDIFYGSTVNPAYDLSNYQTPYFFTNFMNFGNLNTPNNNIPAFANGEVNYVDTNIAKPTTFENPNDSTIDNYNEAAIYQSENGINNLNLQTVTNTELPTINNTSEEPKHIANNGLSELLLPQNPNHREVLSINYEKIPILNENNVLNAPNTILNINKLEHMESPRNSSLLDLYNRMILKNNGNLKLQNLLLQQQPSGIVPKEWSHILHGSKKIPESLNVGQNEQEIPNKFQNIGLLNPVNRARLLQQARYIPIYGNNQMLGTPSGLSGLSNQQVLPNQYNGYLNNHQNILTANDKKPSGNHYLNPNIQNMFGPQNMVQQEYYNEVSKFTQPEQLKYQNPAFPTPLGSATNYEQHANLAVGDKIPNSQQWLNVANLYKLNSVPDKTGLIELTYLLKIPEPIYYQPFYVVKYRVPYVTFLNHLRGLLSTNPQLRSQPTLLHNELLNNSNITEVSSALKDFSKDDIKKLLLRNGEFVKANVINSNNTFLDEQLKIIRNINSNLDFDETLRIIDNMFIANNITAFNGKKVSIYPETEARSDLLKPPYTNLKKEKEILARHIAVPKTLVMNRTILRKGIVNNSQFQKVETKRPSTEKIETQKPIYSIRQKTTVNGQNKLSFNPLNGPPFEPRINFETANVINQLRNYPQNNFPVTGIPTNEMNKLPANLMTEFGQQPLNVLPINGLPTNN